MKPNAPERVMPGTTPLPGVRITTRASPSTPQRDLNGQEGSSEMTRMSAALPWAASSVLRQRVASPLAVPPPRNGALSLPPFPRPAVDGPRLSPPSTRFVESLSDVTAAAAQHNTNAPPSPNHVVHPETSVDSSMKGDTEKVSAEQHEVVNGYAVPDFVQSAGGLQSLSFLIDHRDDLAGPDGMDADLTGEALHQMARRGDPEDNKHNIRNAEPGAALAELPDLLIPEVHARIPTHLAARVRPGACSDAEDDWYDMSTVDPGDGEDERKFFPDGAPDKTGATESDPPSETLSDGCTTLSHETPNDSILMPTARRTSRSSEGSLTDSIPFNNRVVMRQEADADLQCFHAYEYVLSFFDKDAQDVEEARSCSSRSSQASRPSSRNRVAVVHGTDFQEKRSLRRIPTEEERKAAFLSRSLKELHRHVARAYQVAGIPKGYLDALYMTEVEQGLRELRPHDARHPGRRGDPVSPPSSDEDEVVVRLRSTEVVVADYDVDNALQHAFRLGDIRGGGGGGGDGGSGGARFAEKAPVTREIRNGQQPENRRGKGKTGRGAKRGPAATATTTAGKAGAPRRPPQCSAYAFMLRMLWKNTLHFDYQHNALPLYAYKALRRSGNVAVNGKTFRLPIWDDERTGYLVTGVFDRTLGYPKNYRDPLTNELYAEEMTGGSSTSFPIPEMRRQHTAVNARCVNGEDGVMLRGCSILRHPDVYGMYDGRVYGCQASRSSRDHRRTGMHAAIQCLAHYAKLFSKYNSLTRLLHPQDRYRYPVVNPVGGMYCVPLIINGAARLVKVDDYVPMDPATGVFRCFTSSAIELFPTLLEKALLKANGGGVTFALMEPCQVLHQLCGWIPQVIPFVTDYAGNEVFCDGMLYAVEMWDWLSDLYRRGRLAMSLVGLWESEEAKYSPTFVRRNILSRPPHFTAPVSFPAVDVVTRMHFTEGRGMREIRAVMLRDTTKDPTNAEFVPPVRTSLSDAALTSLGYTAVHRDAGVFCVTWEEATTLFDHCSVSLCPSTYWSKEEVKPKPKEPTRICCHDTYDMRNEGRVMFHQPQYHLCFNNVESSTQVFVVYTQHTSVQHPLPWPCEGLSNTTVDRCSGGGPAVKLRVFEVTHLPSILQVKRDGRGTTSRSCTFTNCIGRRLTGELEGPRATRLVARAVGRANTMITVAFDVSPGSREYVLVVDAEADRSTDPVVQMTSFPFTLTLYTDLSALEQANPRCVPFVAARAPNASTDEGHADERKPRLRKLMDDGDGPRKAPAPTATMHAIPPALEVNARTVSGAWGTNRTPKRVAVVKHDLVTEELWTGPQFHLRLTQPDDFFIRLYSTSQSSLTPASAAVKLLLVRRTTPGNSAVVRSPMRQCDLVLESNGWSTEGAALDSFSPHTVLLDRKHELVQSPMRTRREFNAVINMVLYLDPEDEVEEASCLLARHPDPADCVQSLIVRAFAQGMLISPEACRVTLMGQPIPQDWPIRKLLSNRKACYVFNATTGESAAVEEEAGSQSYACREPCLDIFVDIECTNTSRFMAMDFPDNEHSGRLVSRLRAVAQQMLFTGTQQRTKALRALTHICTLIRQSKLAEEKANFLLGIARGLTEWRTARAACKETGGQSPPLVMGQLPAGDYTIVTCFKPTPGAYVRNRKNPRGAPTLAAVSDVHFNVEVQLLRQPVELTAIALTTDPVTKHASSHSALLNEYRAAS